MNPWEHPLPPTVILQSPIGGGLARAAVLAPSRHQVQRNGFAFVQCTRSLERPTSHLVAAPLPLPGETPMSLTHARSDTGADPVEMARDATAALEALLADATLAVRALVSPAGHVSSRIMDREQRATHGLAWLATYVEAVQQLAAYSERMRDAGRLGELRTCGVP